MSSTDSDSPDRLRFQHETDLTEGKAKAELKHRYGRGFYVQDVYEASTDELVITLGNSVPKDVSDCREQDRVLQFINIRDVYTLRAEPTGEGYYLVELPDRDDVYDGFVERRNQILNRLDWSMAKAIYDEVFQLTPVKNQLNPIIQIIRWVREHGPLTVERIDNAQDSDNTKNYLNVLAELHFLRIEDGEVTQGEKMQAADLLEKDTDEYLKAVVGDIVKDGYSVLHDQLDLRMLSHYPKFSNAYYYTALQRENPELWLDVDAVTRNYARQYGEEQDWLVVNDKLNELADTGVIHKDGEYVQSELKVYNQVVQETPVA